MLDSQLVSWLVGHLIWFWNKDLLLVPRLQSAELDCCVNTLVARIITAVSVPRINLDVVHILALIPVINKRAFSICITTYYWVEKCSTYNSYIPQTEQHSPLGFMLFCLGNVTYLLDVTLATHCHTHYHLNPLIIIKTHYHQNPLSSTPISTMCYSNTSIWLLSNIQ